MEGPYRDLGAGFARLLGAEGLRRSPGHLRSVEDALFELLRNSRDAGARNVYIATSLSARRYRELVVIDDGCGIPETHKHLVFEPGVTSRHLDPVPEGPSRQDSIDNTLHGAGLSLYHLKNAALSAEVHSALSPTAIRVVFDTRSLPEKHLQSSARPSKTNLPATLVKFAADSDPNSVRLYYASPARILARLLERGIILRSEQDGETKNNWEGGRVRDAAISLGVEVSLRTVQRVLAGQIPAAEEVVVASAVAAGSPDGLSVGGSSHVKGQEEPGGPILSVGAEDIAEIKAVLRRAAGSSYLELSGLNLEARPGEVILRACVYEQEDEYD